MTKVISGSCKGLPVLYKGIVRSYKCAEVNKYIQRSYQVHISVNKGLKLYAPRSYKCIPRSHTRQFPVLIAFSSKFLLKIVESKEPVHACKRTDIIIIRE